MEVVKLLLENEADPNQADEVRTSPFHVPQGNSLCGVHIVMTGSYVNNAKPNTVKHDIRF